MIDDKENVSFTPVKLFTENDPSTSISRIADNSGEQSVDITGEIDARAEPERRTSRSGGSGSGRGGGRRRRRSRRRSSLNFTEESLDGNSISDGISGLATPSKPNVLSIKAPQIAYTPVKKKQLTSTLSTQQQQQQAEETNPVSQIQQQAKNLFFKRRRMGRKAAASPRKRKIAKNEGESEEGPEVDSMGREMEQSDLAAPKSVLEETFDYYDTHCADLIKSVDVSDIGAGYAFPGSEKLSLGKGEQEKELELDDESFIDPEYNI